MDTQAGKSGGRVLGLIPARAGSVRLPGKNMRPMAGRPMLGWTLAAAKAAVRLDHLAVTTDDADVAALARAEGFEVVNRPTALADAQASVVDAIDHASTALGGGFDWVALLQPTSPLRLAQDIDGAVELALAQDATVVSVSPLAKPSAFHGRIQADGRYRPAPEAEGLTALNGAVYVSRLAPLLRDRTFQTPDALAYIMPAERAWDVDTLEEFAACEAVLRLR
ncbi:MAG: acylneuraminate cytidylyltransferase family protein [Brevundimonas sp.]|nr:MAG: acylneuraminate cytidylyltransferase family protein [Brevundimonas sp.]